MTRPFGNSNYMGAMLNGTRSPDQKRSFRDSRSGRNSWGRVLDDACEIGIDTLPVDIGNGLFACVVSITPEQAADILKNHHIDNNRSPKQTAIGKYASDMRGGRWRLTHQGIAFNADGKLCDGQNRLNACIEAGVPFTTVVFFGVGAETLVNLDSMVKRSAKDAANIAGRSTHNSTIASVRLMATGTQQRQLSNEQMVALLDLFSGVTGFIDAEFPVHLRGITTANIKAAIGRASYHIDRERLNEFCKALREGVITDRDSDLAVITLLRWCQNYNVNSGTSTAIEGFLKASNAIRYYESRTPLAKLYAKEDSVYPLPLNVQEAVAEILT